MNAFLHLLVLFGVIFAGHGEVRIDWKLVLVNPLAEMVGHVEAAVIVRAVFKVYEALGLLEF